MLGTILTLLLSIVGTTTSFFVYSSNALLAQATTAVTTAIVANTPPTIETLTIAGNSGAPSSSFERTITFTGFVDDQNGESDVTGVSLVSWRDGNPQTTSCAADPNQCYIVSSCTTDANIGNTTEVWYHCVFSIPQAYAYGTWYAHVIATDLDNATGTSTEPFPIDAFSFETTTTNDSIGSYGPTEIVTPPLAAPADTSGQEVPTPTTDGGDTPQDSTPTVSTATSDTDCVSAFYQRIEKPEPAIHTAPRHTEACSDSLRVAARDSGLLVFDVSDDTSPTKTTTRAMVVELPPGASSAWLTLFAERLTLENYPHCGTATSAVTCSLFSYSVLNDTFFHVYAEDHFGDTLASLNAAARITLVIPEDMSKMPVHVYRLNASGTAWEEITLETSDAYTVTFRTTELGIFAILANGEQSFVDREFSRILTLLLVGTILILLISIALLAIFALRRKRRVALIQGPMRSSPHHEAPNTPSVTRTP